MDTSLHSVPLEDVVFDTFRGGFIRLPNATEEVIEALRDAIRPIYQPRYDGPEGGRWLQPGDLVIGYRGASAAYAYPVKMLNFHEIVNDVIDEVPVLVTYCPLCASGVVFDRRLDGETLVFGNTSALYENDLVMFDYRTGSYWFQSGGEAIVGTLTGSRLKPLASAILPWQSWLDLHPQTRVLSRDQGFEVVPNYDRDLSPISGGEDDEYLSPEVIFPFPITIEKLDPRLRPTAVVISVAADGQEKAYPLEQLGDRVVNDVIGEEPVLVISQEGPFGLAFSRRVDGRVLTFDLQDDRIRDLETGSRWDLVGRSVAGPLAGEELQPLPTRRGLWFTIALAIPEIPLYQP